MLTGRQQHKGDVVFEDRREKLRQDREIEKLTLSKMKRFRVAVVLIWLAILPAGTVCFADTFRHRKSGEMMHGYVTSKSEQGKTSVHTQLKGVVDINLAEWQITGDRLGRNNKVVVLPLQGSIMRVIETDALIEAITKASDQGPLFILIEMNTPGGRTDYTQRICTAITMSAKCPVVGFVTAGNNGGAISAGAAVAFACDKIYMAPNTVIGAAAPLAYAGGQVKDIKEVYDAVVAEKIVSAWRSYLASLAEHRDRPGLLAGAMADENLEVIEVLEADKRLFIEPINKMPQQNIVQTWSKKGSLLTLTAEQAVGCRIADQVVVSRVELLRHLKADDAQVVEDDSFRQAGQQYARIKKRFDRIVKSLDLKVKQFKQAPTEIRALKMLRDIRKDYKSLISLAQHYSDLNVDVAELQRQLNTVEAYYEQAKMTNYRRR
jgi:ATP-dependent protease ClpP protease subunit